MLPSPMEPGRCMRRHDDFARTDHSRSGHHPCINQRNATCDWGGAARAQDAQGTPSQSHTSPSILVYEDKTWALRLSCRQEAFPIKKGIYAVVGIPNHGKNAARLYRGVFLMGPACRQIQGSVCEVLGLRTEGLAFVEILEQCRNMVCLYRGGGWGVPWDSYRGTSRMRNTPP